ncbi:MAG: hypothetical protein GTO67_02285, partial [Gammaproteobacteria bacterium]|nr:hypothetical protein [Gammaproteobacteria bacterium]NIN37564.1 hypothetical protein [Gammaproteobacteria bacterium]NIO23418.1 hypothetical protein [Gammaproteobacteria bacterium]NIO65075.1 hypothetical protein [Gammaproteobacteria bacterium]NIP63049.1 hypothetical protein [Gammaproteobacteria bacterium]
DAYGALLEAGQFHRSFEFEALGLTVRNWESFEIVTDDPVGGPEVGGPEVGGPVAANDSVIEGAAVIQEQE